MLNEATFKENWDRIKEDVKVTWARLKEDSIAKVKGNMNQFIGLVQDEYGTRREEVVEKLDQIVSKLKESGREADTGRRFSAYDDRTLDNPPEEKHKVG